MRRTMRCWLGLTGVALVGAGCVSLPPVVHVEHKTDQREVIQRIEAINQRLDRLEQQTAENTRLELQMLRREVEELRKQAEPEEPPPGS